jgi:hypothetical protein
VEVVVVVVMMMMMMVRLVVRMEDGDNGGGVCGDNLCSAKHKFVNHMKIIRTFGKNA